MASKKKGRGASKKKKLKTSSVKLSNKRISKLAKQGKLKKRKNVKVLSDKWGKPVSGSQSQQHVNNNNHHNEQLDDEDIEYFGTNTHDSSFRDTAKSRLLNGDSKVLKRKRKQNEDEEQEEDYERLPRKIHVSDNDHVKALLPIKTKTGTIVPQMVEMNQDDEQADTTEQNEAASSSAETEQEELPMLSGVQMYADRKNKLQDRKNKIASLAGSVIENPEQNTKKLRELRLMLEESDPDVFLTVRKLVMVSLMEVFKDIIPGYRIRVITDAEKNTKLKKETKSLRAYEESFLMNYRGYLEFLERLCKGKSSTSFKKRRQISQNTEIPPESAKSMAQLARSCMCELLRVHPHFNYRNNIITVLVPYMNNHDDEVSKVVCETVKTVFREDKSGEVTLEIVRCIGKMIKVREFKVRREVLDTFLCLKIKEVDFDRTDDDKEDGKTRKERNKKLSRRERKQKKRTELLEKELLETKATEDKKKKLRLHTDIIEAVFLTYFRILKGTFKSVLLSAVLEGLAKFAHLINVEFLDDLFSVFNELIDSGNLTYRESLHCVQTAFTILTGQGSVLNIDPMRFYRHLYTALFKVHAGLSSEDLPIVLSCVECMLGRRKRQISQQRVLAFLKRIGTLCLHQEEHSVLALLAAMRGIIVTYKCSELLFDNETQGSGVFQPELPEPEHSNAHNSMLWELTYLQHHYHPVVQRYASHVSKQAPSSGEGQLAPDLSRKSPQEMFSEYSLPPPIFNSDKPPPVKCKRKMWKTKEERFLQSSFDDFMKQTMSSVDNDAIDNFIFVRKR